MAGVIFLNDVWVEESEALVPVSDRGFLFGDGIFESLRAYSGKVFSADRHLERFFKSAKKLKIKIPKTQSELACIVRESLEKNNLKDAYIRITLSRGLNTRGIDLDTGMLGTLVVRAVSFSEESLDSFMDVCFVNTRRMPAEVLDPSIKSANFLNNIIAKDEAKEKSCSEGIMLSMSGHVAEGCISNVFWVKDNSLFTPDLSVGILPGITREIILEIAGKEGIDVSLGHFTAAELLSADEVFLTNSLMEVMPARCIEWGGERKCTEGGVADFLKAKYRDTVFFN